jgi:hypothetical protein
LSVTVIGVPGGPPTPQGDLYSLGELMFTVLSGRYPYEADEVPANAS